jgi:hypothetical protein
VRGKVDENGAFSGKQGKIFTVLGKQAVEHSLDQITAEINVIGRRLRSGNAKIVAVCLTDSIELLASIFGQYFKSYLVVVLLTKSISWSVLWIQGRHHPSQSSCGAVVWAVTEGPSRFVDCRGWCARSHPGCQR